MINRTVSFKAMLLAGSIAAFPLAQASAGADDAVQPVDYVAGSWMLYRHEYVTQEGRVIDTRANGISHSEGQGYGMLIAAIADDRKSFERIWGWTKANLYVRGDNLAAWRWDPAATPHVADTNNATDGDLLIGWALAKAAHVWKDSDYARDAKRIAEEIADKTVVDTAFGKALLPGERGFGATDQPDGPVVNLSYWVYPAIAELGVASSRFPADELIRTGLSLTQTARFGPAALPADWISLKGKTPMPASAYPAQFGHDAIRIPLYLAWYSRDHSDLLTPFADAWRDTNNGAASVIELANATTLSQMPEAGYRAVTELVGCSLGRETAAPTAAAFETTDYYPSTLHLLSLVAVAERYPRCLPDTQ
ncbi:glycosyl hydrolase family 8 [Rhizobium sp. NPDC090275]|uniref:glycosyl hydrolase family 8 n=1 Tax=Rhizobium sp. NPDC090275 TaxID=3364498 RepID=UPI00383AFF88